MKDFILREQIVELLQGGQAHMTIAEAVKNFPEKDINTVFPHGTYTAWALLEHIRLTQHDILEFLVSHSYVEPEWPKDYWPKNNEKVTKPEWDKTLRDYFEDLKYLEKLLMGEAIDLTAKVPNGTGQTYLREFLLVADHTSYHVGEFAIMRQTLRTWKRS